MSDTVIAFYRRPAGETAEGFGKRLRFLDLERSETLPASEYVYRDEA